jgi:hypothetical protein
LGVYLVASLALFSAITLSQNSPSSRKNSSGEPISSALASAEGVVGGSASASAVHEAGHVLVGLSTGRRVVEVWVRGKEGCVDFEPFRWFPGGVARIRRGLAVDVAGHLAEDLAAGCNRDRLSRLAGRYSSPIQLDDRAVVRKARAIRTGELLDDYDAERVFWQQAGHGLHEDILAEIVRAERRAERILQRRWVAFLKLENALSRRPCGRMSARQVVRLSVVR